MFLRHQRIVFCLAVWPVLSPTSRIQFYLAVCPVVFPAVGGCMAHVLCRISRSSHYLLVAQTTDHPSYDHLYLYTIPGAHRHHSHRIPLSDLLLLSFWSTKHIASWAVKPPAEDSKTWKNGLFTTFRVQTVSNTVPKSSIDPEKGRCKKINSQTHSLQSSFSPVVNLDHHSK
jgi:hypothetical protein